jgi:hypothetical protein
MSALTRAPPYTEITIVTLFLEPNLTVVRGKEQRHDEGVDKKLVMRLVPIRKSHAKPDRVRDALRFFARKYYGWDVEAA